MRLRLYQFYAHEGRWWITRVPCIKSHSWRARVFGPNTRQWKLVECEESSLRNSQFLTVCNIIGRRRRYIGAYLQLFQRSRYQLSTPAQHASFSPTGQRARYMVFAHQLVHCFAKWHELRYADVLVLGLLGEQLQLLSENFGNDCAFFAFVGSFHYCHLLTQTQ